MEVNSRQFALLSGVDFVPKVNIPKSLRDDEDNCRYTIEIEFPSYTNIFVAG
jgi:hypothetical protein